MTGIDTAATPGSAGASTNALEVRDVEAGYDRTTILRDVSLDVPAGEVTALLGPNGAGKTTLLRTVSGLLPCTRGSVSLFGDDVTKLAPHRRFARGLCHIPEGRGVFRSLTVRENLVMQSKRGQERRPSSGPRARSRCCTSGSTRRPARSAAVSSRCSRWRPPTSATPG